MDLHLTDKLAVVTGAAQGIGEAIAEAFAGEGARLLLVDREEKVRDVAGKLGAAAAVRDLRSRNAAEEIAREADAAGGAAALINNAGISRPAPLPELGDEDWEATMDVNASAPFRLIRAFWPQLSRHSGAVINLASFAAKRSTLFGGNVAYVASKHALAGLTRAAAFEGAARNVRVNAIAPGVVATEMVMLHDEAARERIRERIPLGRFAEPSEIADLALFLASPRAAHICGEVVNVNGGLRMD